LGFFSFNWLISICIVVNFFGIPSDSISSFYAGDESTMLVVDHHSGFIALRNSCGKIVWKQEGRSLYEAWAQTDGSIVYSTRKQVIKILPDLQKGSGGEILWKYEYGSDFDGLAPEKGGIYTCTPINGNRFLVTESGTYRLLEIDKNGVLKKTIQLPVAKNPNSNHTLRMSTKTEKGHYLVSYFGDGFVIEFDRSGKLLKEINIGKLLQSPINSAYQASLLKNGNLLVSCGTQNQIIILNANQEIVWKLTPKDVGPNIDLNWIAQVTPLENGNLLVCNYGDGNAKILAFEITMNKKIIWTLVDSRFKGLSMLQILPNNFKN